MAILNSIAEIENKLIRQKKRLQEEGITHELYLEFKQELGAGKRGLEAELAKGVKGVSNAQECIDFAISYSLKLPSLWASAGYVEKQRLQFLLFPEGIFYDRVKDRGRTNNANEVFQCIAELKRLSAESKSRNPKKNLDDAAWVELGHTRSNDFITGLKIIADFIASKKHYRAISGNIDPKRTKSGSL